MDSKGSVCFLWKVMLLLIVVTSHLWEVNFHKHLKVLWSSTFFVISTTLHRSFHLYDNEIQCRFVLLLTTNDSCKLLSIINTVNFYRTQTENRKYALALAFPYMRSTGTLIFYPIQLLDMESIIFHILKRIFSIVPLFGTQGKLIPFLILTVDTRESHLLYSQDHHGQLLPTLEHSYNSTKYLR